MKKLKKVVLVFLLTSFIFISNSFLLGNGIDRTILEESFYKDSLDRAKISPLVVDAFSQVIKDVPEEEREVIEISLSKTLEEEWVRENFLLIVGDLLPFLKGEKESLTAVISLKERKEIFQRKMEEGLPEDVELKEEVLEELPNEIALSEIIEENDFSEEIKSGVILFRQAYNYFNIASLFFLSFLIILFIILAGTLGSLKWIGGGMFLTGALTYFNVSFIKGALLQAIKEQESIDPGFLTVTISSFLEEISCLAVTYGTAELFLLLVFVTLSNKEKIKEFYKKKRKKESSIKSKSQNECYKKVVE